MKWFVILLLVAISSSTVYAQTDEEVEELIFNGANAEKEGDWQRAIIYYEQSKRSLEKLNKESEAIYIFISYKLANCYNVIGDYANVGKNIEVGAEVLEVIQEEDPKFAIFSHNLADCYFVIGEYPRAIEICNKALEACLKTKGEAHPDYLMILRATSLYLKKYGDYSKAIELYTKELNFIKNRYGENNPEYASAMNHIALCYSDLGDYPHAIEYGIKTSEIRENVLGDSHPDYAQSLSNLNTYYNYLHDYPHAIEYGTKALKILKTALGENNSDYATSLNNLSYSYYGLGEYSKAIELGTKALEIEEATSNKHSKNYAVLSNLALYNSCEGNILRAIELSYKALEICKSTKGEVSPDFSTILSNIALYYSHSGNFYKAKELGIKALDIQKKVAGDNNPLYLSILRFVATCDIFLGNYSEASKNITRCVSLYNSNILKFFCDLSSYQRYSYWESVSSLFTDLYPSIAYQSNSYNTSDLYNQSALFAKGLLLTTSSEISRLIKESSDVETVNIFEKYCSIKRQLLKLYEIPMAEERRDIDSLNSLVERLEKRLINRSKEIGDFSQKLRTTWNDIQNILDDDDIAIEFLSFDLFGTDSTLIAALTLKKGDIKPKFFPLFTIDELKKLTDLNQLNGLELKKIVWEPLMGELSKIHNIYFSPAGVLHKIGIEYALGMEEFEMYRLTSTRKIRDIKHHYNNPNDSDLLNASLFGGIDYEKQRNSFINRTDFDNKKESTFTKLFVLQHRAFIDSLDLRGVNVSYLPGSLKEVQNIKSTFDRKQHKAVLYIGSEATESTIKNLTGSTSTILHVATHGFYFTQNRAKKLSLRFLLNEEFPIGSYEDKALTRSGILFAGANKALNGADIPMDTDDGILTAQEISQLDLQGIDLVVLSACDTGIGDIIQGEGIFGLQRGFKKAGAGTIMMSLWKVNDIATNILMTEFYNNLCSGMDKRKSLRSAQKKLREYKDPEGNLLFQDPYYWASFVMLD